MSKSVILGMALFASIANIEARASIIFQVTSSVTLADPTQTGRLSRNGVPQDWGFDETFPGEINTMTTYHYETFSINVGATP